MSAHGHHPAGRPWRAVDPSDTTIPLATPQPGTLFGREHECSLIANRLLHPVQPMPLVALLGPPGVGKTRLAEHMARELAGAFDTEPMVVYLAAEREPSRVLGAIARGFGVLDPTQESVPLGGANPAQQGGGNDPAQRLFDRLADRIGLGSRLLVLDNFEHLLAAKDVIPALFERCPGLRVIVTSRHTLRVHGESPVMVNPLGVADLTAPPAPDRLGEVWAAPAVALFLARAAEAGVPIPRDQETAWVVHRICARLDGLPLAIELAAAQLPRFAPPELLTRLDLRLPVLVAPSTGADQERVRTMRGSIAWSYDLLPPELRTLFNRLSVFVGGFDLNAAVAMVAGWQPDEGYPICGGMRMPYISWDLLYGKESPGDLGAWHPVPLPPLALNPAAAMDDLLDRQLIRGTSSGGTPRYEMLETLREFGQEQLPDSGEAEAAHNAHMARMLAVAEIEGTALTQHDRRATLRRIVPEMGNVAAALAWLATQTAAFPAANQLSLRLADALGNLWQTTGRATLGRTWLDAALARPGGSAAARASALYNTGLLAWIQGDYRRADAAFTDGMILARGCGFRATEARCLFGLGLVALATGDEGATHARLTEAVAIFATCLDPIVHGLCLVALGMGARTEAARSVGAPAAQALAVAADLLEQAPALFEPHGFGWGVATARLFGADVARLQGNRARAVVWLRDALKRYHAEEDPWGTGAALGALAIYVAEDGDIRRATRLFGAVAALQGRGGTILPPTDRDRQQLAVDAIRADLGDAVFAPIFLEGQAMDALAAINDALSVPTTVPKNRAPAPSPALVPPPELTERQIDLIQRLADGRTVKEICSDLALSQSYVYTQFGAIRSLLNAQTDAQLVAVAVRSGLI